MWFRITTRPVPPATGKGTIYYQCATTPDQSMADAAREYRVSSGREEVGPTDQELISFPPPFLAGLFALGELLQAGQRAALERSGYTNIDTVHFRAWHVWLVEGRKYWNVNVGDSGKYMVDKETGTIYGIKAYGVPHKGHVYGTLATVAEWNWSGYTAQQK